MKKIKYLVLLCLSTLILIPSIINAKEKVNLYLFYSKDCPHCHDEIEYLNSIKDNYSNLNIITYEVKYDEKNYELLNKVKEAFECTNQNVPYTVIGTQTYTGYNSNTSFRIEKAIDYYSNNKSRDIVSEIINNNFEEKIIVDDVDEDKNIYDIPLLGKVNIKKISIPFLAVVIGLVDGFNPCAMWVLLFLISMLLGMKDKKRMWILGITFLATSAFIYMLFMVSWLKVALSLSEVTWIQILIGVIAIVGAFVNLKSYYKSVKNPNNGCTVVDDKKRKKIFSRIKKLTSEKSFILALIGIMALAISVNIVELACSAGLPVLFTQILSLNNLSTLEYIINILIYILFFLFDDIIIFSIAMISFKVTGISTKYTKYSHLIGGIIMLIIGIFMILKPNWLMFNF